jgi:hydroxymethylglutaryl-CoA reductase
MNGVDAVVLATGNDRAVEAGIHAYAAKSGQYSAYLTLKLKTYITFWLIVSLGTVGGLTTYIR